jgi:hypothetical protein
MMKAVQVIAGGALAAAILLSTGTALAKLQASEDIRSGPRSPVRMEVMSTGGPVRPGFPG